MYIIAGIALVSSMFLTVLDVFLRIFKRPIVGTYELVGLLGAIVIGFAMPQTSRVRGHVVMDFLTDRVPALLKSILHVFTRLLGIVTFAIIGWNLAALGNDFKTVGEVSATLQLPVYPVAYGLAACCAVECLVLFVDIFGQKESPK